MQISERLPIKQAQRLLEESQDIVPVISGKLKKSGHLEIKEEENSVSVIYDMPYANKVHENPNSKGYKFLEKTSDRLREELIEEYAKSYVKAMFKEG